MNEIMTLDEWITDMQNHLEDFREFWMRSYNQSGEKHFPLSGLSADWDESFMLCSGKKDDEPSSITNRIF